MKIQRVVPSSVSALCLWAKPNFVLKSVALRLCFGEPNYLCLLWLISDYDQRGIVVEVAGAELLTSSRISVRKFSRAVTVVSADIPANAARQTLRHQRCALRSRRP